MEATLTAWGTSVGIRIPKKILERLKLKIKDKVDFSVRDNEIVLVPIADKPKYTLEELMQGDLTPINIDKGDPIGDEIW